MSFRKRALKVGLAAGSLLSISGHEELPPKPTSPPPIVLPASIDVPEGITDPDGYQRLVAARKTLDACIDLFASDGLNRIKASIGMDEFHAGGELCVIPPHAKNQGECAFHSNGKTINLPELLYLFNATASVMQAQYDYDPCPIALKISPQLKEPRTFANVKSQIQQCLERRKDALPPALSEVVDLLVEGPIKDFCAFSNTIPGAKKEGNFSQIAKQSLPSTTTTIAAESYWLPKLPFFTKVWNGAINIKVVNSRFQEKTRTAQDATPDR